MNPKSRMFLLGAALIAAPAFAHVPTAFQSIRTRVPSFHVLKKFPVSKLITGYVVEVHQRRLIVYGVGNAMITGTLIGANGHNLTASEHRRYLPNMPADKVVQSMRKSGHLITQGSSKAATTLYVVVDPNCIYCHEFFQRIQPVIKHGKVRVKWDVAGFLKPSSQGKAVAILSAKNPLKALKYDEAHFHPRIEEGGIQPTQNARLEKIVHHNTTLLFKSGANGTPAIFYRAKGHWHLMNGVPDLKQFEAIMKHRVVTLRQ